MLRAAWGKSEAGSSMAAMSMEVWTGPLAAITPNSAKWPRSALMACVRWRTSRSRVRNTTAAACIDPLGFGGFDPRLLPLADELALHLGDHAQHGHEDRPRRILSRA
jgi:hypothetical protein